jgi:hypothetical protein
MIFKNPEVFCSVMSFEISQGLLSQGLLSQGLLSLRIFVLD